jgi:hypothetical protein
MIRFSWDETKCHLHSTIVKRLSKDNHLMGISDYRRPKPLFTKDGKSALTFDLVGKIRTGVCAFVQLLLMEAK